MRSEEIIDRLYGLPPEEFTRARDEAVGELRKAGKREQAEEVKAFRKPTADAAVVNQLVRNHRPQVEAFLHAAATLRDAQLAGKGDLASAVQRQRRALEKLVELGGDAVRPTLQAAAVDDDVARELLEARLQREPEPRGFGTLLAHARPGTGSAAAGPTSTKLVEPNPPRPDDGAARARLQDARGTLAAAASEERQARRHWTQRKQELEKAEAAVERAQRELDRLHGR